MSDALVSLSRAQIERACRLFDRLATLDPHDFVAWYGLGNCLSRDDVVLRNSLSPSGWAFRSSYRRGTNAFQRAYQLLPSIHRSLRGGAFEAVRRMLFTSHTQLRSGRALSPDTIQFAAYPTWEHDTLAFVPYPQHEIVSLSPATPQATTLAIRHERELFHEIATAWVTAFPQSADATEALAVSLELLGDPQALETIRHARALATSADEQVRVGTAEVWMRVKVSIPGDLLNLRIARALADSLLRTYAQPGGPDPLLLASLAALTGRAQLTAELTRVPSVASEWSIPAPLARTAFPLLSFAALGGPDDSLRVLEQQVSAAIEAALVMPARRVANLEWLARAATLAFPDYQLRSIARLVGSGDYLLDAQAALMRGDSAAVRQLMTDLRVARRSWLPADLTPDALYPEARLLLAVGDRRGAIAWLDPTLESLAGAAPEVYADPVRAGTLVRAMALRAELAESVHDSAGAARWARPVLMLWSDADDFCRPLLDRMRRLSR